jgi:hypothetical protein
VYVPRLPAEATTPRVTTRALQARLGANETRVAGIAAAKVMAAMVVGFLRWGERVRVKAWFKTQRALRENI